MFDKKKQKKTSETEVASQTVADVQKPPAPGVSSLSVSAKSAVIGATITIKGDINGDENLLIEGTVEGSVDLGGKDLTIGQSGRVQANVTAREIKIEGEVKGDISGNEKVLISKTGKVLGNIIAPRVTLEDGANFKGSIDMNPSDQTFKEPPLKTFKASDKAHKAANDKAQGVPSTA